MRLGAENLVALLAVLGTAGCLHELAYVRGPSHLAEAMPPLIPRADFFHQVGSVDVSPDGKKILIASSTGLRVERLSGAAGNVSASRRELRGFVNVRWLHNSYQAVGLRDTHGDEKWHLFLLDTRNGSAIDLTPFEGATVQEFHTDRTHPGRVLVTLNVRDPRRFDVYAIDLKTKEIRLDTENPGDVVKWGIDRAGIVRAALASNNDLTLSLRVRDTPTSAWRELRQADELDVDRIVGFSQNGRNLLVVGSLGGDKARLAELDGDTGVPVRWWPTKERQGDVVQVLRRPADGRVLAVGASYLAQEWIVVDDSVKQDFLYLQSRLPGGEFHIEGWDDAMERWVVRSVSRQNPGVFFVYDRTRRVLRAVASERPQLYRDRARLAVTQSMIIPARDGLQLPAYITLPPGLEARSLPMVLLVHGGPCARDSLRFETERQWLANRGYSVLQVNYRGSCGFGKRFAEAGRGEWGAKMQDDLTDAVAHLASAGIADPQRIAIMGSSYGGYAALAGLAFTPDLYACGVDIVGPSNLRTFVEAIPEHWHLWRERLLRDIGGNVLEDDSLNRARSPLFHVDAIRKPLLVAHGINDPRVNVRESEQIVAALNARRLDVEYVAYENEGHGTRSFANRDHLMGRVEAFLARCLNGRYELIRGSTQVTAVDNPVSE